MVYGTPYFVTRLAAGRYYAAYGASKEAVDAMLAEGAIHIGKPDLKPGQRLVVLDNGCRYGIQES